MSKIALYHCLSLRPFTRRLIIVPPYVPTSSVSPFKYRKCPINPAKVYEEIELYEHYCEVCDQAQNNCYHYQWRGKKFDGTFTEFERIKTHEIHRWMMWQKQSERIQPYASSRKTYMDRWPRYYLDHPNVPEELRGQPIDPEMVHYSTYGSRHKEPHDLQLKTVN